ncbi:MAG: flagellar biosynthetic protein FliO, partial [Chloroflexota bacterium]
MTRGLRSLHVRVTAAIIGGALPLFVAAPALAQAAVPTHEVGGVAGYSAWDWISLTFRMAAVLGVIWGSVVAMRWYVRRMNGEANGGLTRALQIVETRALGPSRALHLVRIGDRAVLIGATPERINALMEIDDPGQLQKLFSGDHDVARRTPTLLAGLAMLPSMMSGVRASMSARADAQAAFDADEAFFATGEPTLPVPSPRRAAPSAAGFLTSMLTRLGRRMRGASKQQPPVRPVAPAPATPMFNEMTEVPPTIAALQQALEARIAPKIRPAASLFDRTLADAQRLQGGVPAEPVAAPVPAAPMFAREPGLATAGLRARAGYTQAAAPSLDD